MRKGIWIIGIIAAIAALKWLMAIAIKVTLTGLLIFGTAVFTVAGLTWIWRAARQY